LKKLKDYWLLIQEITWIDHQARIQAGHVCPVDKPRAGWYYLITLSDFDMSPTMENEFFAGFIRLHILYHASEEPVFGLGILRELRRHGYELSPGTLYPLLHRMEERGLLKSEKEQVVGKIRRIYRISELGRRTLLDAREKVRELFGELFSDESVIRKESPSVEKEIEKS